MTTLALGSLVRSRLTKVAEDLSKAVEDAANEREKALREENEDLRKENEALRRRFVIDVDNEEYGKTVRIDDGSVASSSDRLLTVVEAFTIPKTSSIASNDVSHMNLMGNQEFELLPELLTRTAEELCVVATHGEPHHKHKFPVSSISAERILSDMKRCYVSPTSPSKLGWDMLGIPVLAWDIITIPLGVFDLPENLEDVLKAADWITLCYWVIDVFLTFVTGYYDEEGNTICDHRRIAKRYLTGNFLLDFVVVVTDGAQTIVENTRGNAPDVFKNFSLLRILRLSRFARLFRLQKLKRKLQALEDLFNNEWYLIITDMLVKVLSIVIINHYICCGWYYLGTSTHLGSPSHRWLSALPYPQYDSNGQKMISAPFGYKYLTCMHWAIAQFTPGPQNIQPQNVYERIYAIGVLLFGLVIFSSFIASMTQARMHMTRMMGKFERDHWLLREYCREHKISLQLQRRMKRYVDLVVLPARAKLSIEEVSFINKLSANLREELDVELFAAKLCTHDFFAYLLEYSPSVMNHICHRAIEVMPLAHGDIAFCGGHVAQAMIIVVSGRCAYVPMKSQEAQVKVLKGQWTSEGAFWTNWTHQGQLQAAIESHSLRIDGGKFRKALLHGAMVMNRVRKYGIAFCSHLNDLRRKKAALSDVQIDFAPKYFKSFYQNDTFIEVEI